MGVLLHLPETNNIVCQLTMFLWEDKHRLHDSSSHAMLFCLSFHACLMLACNSGVLFPSKYDKLPWTNVLKQYLTIIIIYSCTCYSKPVSLNTKGEILKKICLLFQYYESKWGQVMSSSKMIKKLHKGTLKMFHTTQSLKLSKFARQTPWNVASRLSVDSV